MPAFAMGMSVLQLFFGGSSHINDLYLEVQALASQRMVAINGHLVTFNIPDGHNLHAAIRRGSMKLHAHLQLIYTPKHVAAQCRNHLQAVLTIGVFRLDTDPKFITATLAAKGLLQPRTVS